MWSSSASAPAKAYWRQADDVLAHQRERRRLDARRGQPADRVDVVVRRQLAGAGRREVGDPVLAVDVLPFHRVVDVVAGAVPGERRVRREQDALADRDVVDALGDRLARRIGRQFPASGVEVARQHHPLGATRPQLVGPLQVVVAVRRLVDLVGVRRLVVGVRTGRIEVLRRARGEGGVKGVARLGAGRMRAVGHAAAGSQRRERRERGGEPEQRAGQNHGGWRSATFAGEAPWGRGQRL